MKIKRTIEIEKCDLCGIEGNHLFKCGHCKNEICNGCHSSVSVIVQHIKPGKAGGFYSLTWLLPL